MSTRPFRETMDALRNGGLNEELDEGWNNLVNKVRDTQKKGVMTIQITLHPTKGTAMEIEDEVKFKVPELAHGTTLLFPTVEGNLVRNDPEQKQLNFSVVDNSTGEIVNVNTSGQLQEMQKVG